MICKRCNEDKEPESFYKDSTRPAGKHPYCKVCFNKTSVAIVRKWRKANPEKRLKQKQRYKEKNRETFIRGCRNRNLRKSFGITLDEYEVMLEAQNNVCAICKTNTDKRSLAVDHCHTTGKIRGLLCINCNRGLGNYKDNIALLEEAIQYLKDSF